MIKYIPLSTWKNLSSISEFKYTDTKRVATQQILNAPTVLVINTARHSFPKKSPNYITQNKCFSFC